MRALATSDRLLIPAVARHPNQVTDGRDSSETIAAEPAFEVQMTSRSDFTEQEWDLLREGPPTAGMIVLTAAHGGTFRETFAIGKAYAEAHEHHGESELVDALVAAKPKADHTRYSSLEELKQHGLQLLRDATALLAEKATAEELDGYRRFVLSLAETVAAAHREGTVAISDPERRALDEIAASLGSSASSASS